MHENEKLIKLLITQIILIVKIGIAWNALFVQEYLLTSLWSCNTQEREKFDIKQK